jgi:hypothetical protein
LRYVVGLGPRNLFILNYQIGDSTLGFLLVAPPARCPYAVRLIANSSQWDLRVLNDLYQDVILEPRTSKMLATADRTAAVYKPLCGGRIKPFLDYESGVVKDVGFQGSGCAISIASASLMTEMLKAKHASMPRRCSGGFTIC